MIAVASGLRLKPSGLILFSHLPQEGRSLPHRSFPPLIFGRGTCPAQILMGGVNSNHALNSGVVSPSVEVADVIGAVITAVAGVGRPSRVRLHDGWLPRLADQHSAPRKATYGLEKQMARRALGRAGALRECRTSRPHSSHIMRHYPRWTNVGQFRSVVVGLLVKICMRLRRHFNLAAGDEMPVTRYLIFFFLCAHS